MYTCPSELLLQRQQQKYQIEYEYNECNRKKVVDYRQQQLLYY